MATPTTHTECHVTECTADAIGTLAGDWIASVRMCSRHGRHFAQDYAGLVTFTVDC